MQLNVWGTFSKGHLFFEFCFSIPLPFQVNRWTVSKLLCNHTLITHSFLLSSSSHHFAIKLTGCTCLVSMQHESSTLAYNKRALHAKPTVKEHHYEKEAVLWGYEMLPYLTAVLFGTMRTADWRGGYSSRQLGVGAQHGIRLSWACRTQFPDAWR